MEKMGAGEKGLLGRDSKNRKLSRPLSIRIAREKGLAFSDFFAATPEHLKGREWKRKDG